ncbi:unnamed protein product [Rhizopus stolonifer]
MGVQGLWSLVGPSARPTQLESLRQQKVAVDASIWIHQFMRTMRDGQGNALQNGHLLGFFRRICKLLFYDIKPVFVFDGGAPSLKRNTIRERRKRREGIKINMKATARKILSAQVKSRALMDEEKRRRGGVEKEEYIDYEELEKSTAVESFRKRQKLDQYELPPERTGELNMLDPRLPTVQEMKGFVEEFAPTTDIIDSDTFQHLTPEIQYEIIQDLKLKSRQTSWARLDQMVRNSKTDLDFSKQQIKMLKHRNDMTQRVMQMNTVAGGVVASEPTRVAGERGRQYILYKNENIDQGLGWKLPGLSAADPLEVDPVKSPEKVIENIKSAPEEDKVKAALANNPKLAALFSDILSDEEETSSENDEPLFVDYTTPSEEKKENKLIENMGAYVDDEAIDQIISKIYKEEIPLKEETILDQQDIDLTLNREDFLKKWLSQVPDAFLYLHSFNDQYVKILRMAIFDSDLLALQNQLTSVRKLFGKTREGDELVLESLKFQERFLESVIQWKEENNPGFLKAIEEDIDESVFLGDDDDDDEEFHFIDSKTVEKGDTPLHLSPLRNPVNINLSQSLLYKQIKPSNLSVNNNNDMIETSKDKNTAYLSNQPKEDPKISTEDFGPNATIETNTTDILNKDNTSNTDSPIYFGEASSPSKVIETDNNNTLERLSQGYDSEEELENNVHGEDDEYARFVSDIASKDLDDVRRDLYLDMKELNQQQKKDRGNTDDVTNQMVQDIQELLKLFGIPFIISPMEAEAQCAALERLKLVDGTITDDSDVFLFGASRVYKNMFNQQRLVECYRSQDIEREMMLDREEMIQLAYLLGSDYTEGIPGVGPVAAMEILAEFSSKKENGKAELPLKKFKEWYNSGKDVTDFQKKFRKRHKDLEIPNDFPSPLVRDAYLYPDVDHSTQPFKWGQPQLDLLRVFLMESFEWSENKADEVLLPVLREMNKRAAIGEQTSLKSFFNTTQGPYQSTNKHSSKRVQNIVENWRQKKKVKH